MNPLAMVMNFGTALIERLIPDPAAKAAATLKLLELQQSGDLEAIAGQLEINKVEAANPSLLVSGWRPACGWVCVSGLAMQFLVGPLFTWIASMSGHDIKFPTLDMPTLMTLLAGMLGLSGMRSYEKLNGVAAK